MQAQEGLCQGRVNVKELQGGGLGLMCGLLSLGTHRFSRGRCLLEVLLRIRHDEAPAATTSTASVALTAHGSGLGAHHRVSRFRVFAKECLQTSTPQCYIL
jgi:hypothetical protein